MHEMFVPQYGMFAYFNNDFAIYKLRPNGHKLNKSTETACAV